jgi:hypothetical protein
MSADTSAFEGEAENIRSIRALPVVTDAVEKVTDDLCEAVRGLVRQA